MSHIAKVTHTGQTIQASVFASVFEQTVMAPSSQASSYERVQLLYKGLRLQLAPLKGAQPAPPNLLACWLGLVLTSFPNKEGG